MKIQKIKYKNQKGAAMMIFLIFVFFLTLTIVFGIISPMMKEFSVSQNLVKGRQSYFLAESGIEDAAYRIKNTMQIDSSETLEVNGEYVVTNITNIGNDQKQISSVSNVDNREKKINLILNTVAGVSFNYGIQTGEGGFQLISGSVNGNIYANGPVYGTGWSPITGSVVSADGPSGFTDQENGSGNPIYNAVFGKTNAEQDVAQSFRVSTNTSPLTRASFYIKKNGSPSNATVKIVSDSSGNPSSTVIATATLSSSLVSTSYGWIEVSFSTNPILNTGTTYWIVIDASNNNSNYYTIGGSGNDYGNGLGKLGRLGSSWSTPYTMDLFFKLYLGGLKGKIESTAGQWNPIPISGDSKAETVTYTNTTGTIYCKVDGGNNKPCNTSFSNPTYESFPVSDINISDWKDEALQGGTLTGNQTIGWAGATMGPKKINGNLTVNGGGTLTLTGPLWVTGNLTLTGGGKIKLDSSFGSDDGVLVADGTISINGGAYATGSGTSGSYMVMITTNTGTSSISGGAGAVVFYAKDGILSISGGASLKSATAYKVILDGGSSLNYESGLADLFFNSGPSGSWSIEHWGEIE